MTRTARVGLGSGGTALVAAGVVAFVAVGAVLDPGRLGQVVPTPGLEGAGSERGVRLAAGGAGFGGALVEGLRSTGEPAGLTGAEPRGARLAGEPTGELTNPLAVAPVGEVPVPVGGARPAPGSVVAKPVPAVPPPDPLTPAALTPAPAPADLAARPALGWGDEGAEVAALQARLAALGFPATETDGSFGGGTWSAVLAFQKFEGLERTGDVTAEVWARLYQPQGWLPPRQRTTAPKVEVDLDRQVLIVLNADHPGHVAILNTSTGGGYYYTNKDGSTDYAYTPEGSYQVYRRYDGMEVAPLGTLYRPMYFVGGWAVHGSPSVPEYPASHGCVRLSNDDADWLWDRAPDDMGVTVRATMDPNLLRQQAWDEWVAAVGEAPTIDVA